MLDHSFYVIGDEETEMKKVFLINAFEQIKTLLFLSCSIFQLKFTENHQLVLVTLYYYYYYYYYYYCL